MIGRAHTVTEIGVGSSYNAMLCIGTESRLVIFVHKGIRITGIAAVLRQANFWQESAKTDNTIMITTYFHCFHLSPTCLTMSIDIFVLSDCCSDLCVMYINVLEC